MIYDLGDVVALGITITNASGVPVNASAVTCTITLPDGTSATPTVSNASTGLYNADYQPTQVGRHVVRWLATGTNASAYVDEFTVRDITQTGCIGLDEAKQHLNIPSATTSLDEELRRFIDAANDLAEQYCGVVLGRRSVAETYNGGADHIRLRTPKAITITSVVEAGKTLTQGTDYYMDPTGQRLYRIGSGDLLTGAQIGMWAQGLQNVVVSYVAGFTNPPASARMGVLEILKHAWQTQRGAANSLTRNDDGYMLGSSFTIPNRAKEYLDPVSLPSIA